MVVKHCPTCKSHKFQDERYGPGKRACTVNMKGEAKCTVCATIIKPELFKKPEKK